MTHLVIHSSETQQKQYLEQLLSHLLTKEKLTLKEFEKLPDVHILKKMKDSIGIEDAKNLIKKIIYKPFEERYQIGVIFNAETLTIEAQNAILKSLEETPKTTQFILLVNNEKNLLDTVVSRCIRHYVKTNSPKVTKKSDSEIMNLPFIDQMIYVENLSKKSRSTIQKFLDDLTQYFREIIVKDLQRNKETKHLIKCIDNISTARIKIKANASKKITLENLIFQLNNDD